MSEERIFELQSEEKQENPPYIKCDSLVRIFKSEGIEVMALQGLDLEVEKGEFIAVIGKSGSGKSTLLNLLGALDRPSAGYVAYDGENINEMSDAQLAKFRNEHIGFVWQKTTDNLLNYLTAVENVEMPLLFSNLSKNRHFTAQNIGRSLITLSAHKRICIILFLLNTRLIKGIYIIQSSCNCRLNFKHIQQLCKIICVNLWYCNG